MSSNKYKNNYTKRNKRLRELGFSSYSEYLKSDTWKTNKKRLLSSKRFREKKCFCGSTKSVCIHHITYKNIGNEKVQDVIPVCKFHHEMIHNYEKEKDCSIRKATHTVRNAILRQKGLYISKKSKRRIRVKNKEVKRKGKSVFYKQGVKSLVKGRSGFKARAGDGIYRKIETKESIFNKYKQLIGEAISPLEKMNLTKQMNQKLKPYL
jgi:hypothetical protein